MGSELALDSLVTAFSAAQAYEQSVGIHHLFDQPSKMDVVRLADKVQGHLTPTQARNRIENWIAHDFHSIRAMLGIRTQRRL